MICLLLLAASISVLGRDIFAAISSFNQRSLGRDILAVVSSFNQRLLAARYICCDSQLQSAFGAFASLGAGAAGGRPRSGSPFGARFGRPILARMAVCPSLNRLFPICILLLCSIESKGQWRALWPAAALGASDQ